MIKDIVKKASAGVRVYNSTTLSFYEKKIRDAMNAPIDYFTKENILEIGWKEFPLDHKNPLLVIDNILIGFKMQETVFTKEEKFGIDGGIQYFLSVDLKDNRGIYLMSVTYGNGGGHESAVHYDISTVSELKLLIKWRGICI